MISGGTPPTHGPAPGESFTDLSSGLYVYSRTDLSVPGPMPIILTRTYRSSDQDSSGNFLIRPFGLGANFNYGIFLYSESEAAGQGYRNVDLILPDGGRLFCNRTSSCSQNGCTDYTDAVFQCTANPSAAFFGATISYNPNTPGWDLERKDGLVYSFGLGAPLQSVRDRYGNQVTLTRTGGQSGDITRIASSNGRYVNLYYNDSLNPHQVTSAQDNSGKTVSYAYDSSHRLTSVTDPTGARTALTWNGGANMLGDLASITDAASNAATISYDTSLRLSGYSIAEGSWSFAYTTDQYGHITACDITDPRAFRRHLTFNSAGYVASETKAVGKPEQQATTYTRYAGSNLIQDMVDQLGRDFRYTYDSLGNLLSVTAPYGTPQAVTTSLTYEPNFSQIASVTDPMGHMTSMSYDASGSLTSLTNPLNNTWTATYNSAGQPLSVSDPLGNTANYTYNASGDLASAADPLGNTAIFTADTVGRLTASRDPLRNTTSFAYDGVNRLTQIADAKGGLTKYAYDAIGRLTKVTDANGHASTFTYTSGTTYTVKSCDALNNCKSRVYDALGNLKSFTDALAKTTTYAYDGLNRGTSATSSSGKTDTYAYDGGNRLTSAVDSAAGTISRAYDILDRVTSETTPQGTVSYTYDNDGRRTGMTAGSQSLTSYTWDAADRLTGASRAGSASIAYDRANRRTSLTLPNGVVVTYGYDAASRLTSLTYTLGTTTIGNLTYSYDKDGRRTAVGGSLAPISLGWLGGTPLSTTATYLANNQLNLWNGTAATSDANGNLTRDPSLGATYAWDGERLSAVIMGPVANTFTYDALGRRQSRALGTWTTSYLYDGFNVVQEQSSLYAGTKTDFLTGLGPNELFTQTDPSGTTASFLADALASTLALTDASGTVQAQYSYAPFGWTTASESGASTSYDFTGASLGDGALYYMRARYYNPTLGRFISPDPIGFAGGINLYAYVHNDPVDFTDRFGLLAGGVGGGYGGMSTAAVIASGADPFVSSSPGFASGAEVGGIPGGMTVAEAADMPGGTGGINGGAPGTGWGFGGGVAAGGAGFVGGGLGGGEVILTQAHGPAPGGPYFQVPPSSPRFSSIYAACIHENLLTGPGSLLVPMCVAGTAACGATLGEPVACVPAIGACLSTTIVRLHCEALSKGKNPPPLPEESKTPLLPP